MVVRVILALNRVYVPHRQLKWQRHLITGLEVAPSQRGERLEMISASRPAVALQVAEALLADTLMLAEAHTDADISSFREVLAERRHPVDPPPPPPPVPSGP